MTLPDAVERLKRVWSICLYGPNQVLTGASVPLTWDKWHFWDREAFGVLDQTTVVLGLSGVYEVQFHLSGSAAGESGADNSTLASLSVNGSTINGTYVYLHHDPVTTSNDTAGIAPLIKEFQAGDRLQVMASQLAGTDTITLLGLASLFTIKYRGERYDLGQRPS